MRRWILGAFWRSLPFGAVQVLRMAALRTSTCASLLRGMLSNLRSLEALFGPSLFGFMSLVTPSIYL